MSKIEDFLQVVFIVVTIIPFLYGLHMTNKARNKELQDKVDRLITGQAVVADEFHKHKTQCSRRDRRWKRWRKQYVRRYYRATEIRTGFPSPEKARGQDP